jgi:DNA mismatch endonuclease (patch repair protein)
MPEKTPSYKGLKPASEVASKAKRSNTRTDTKPELMLRKKLWQNGLRFRKNVKSLPGKPDIVFIKARVVVFCDGDFWHGRNWESRKTKLEGGTNSEYWVAKIAMNIERDKRNTALLEALDWLVLRVWEGDIKKSLETVAGNIETVVRGRLAVANNPKI